MKIMCMVEHYKAHLLSNEGVILPVHETDKPEEKPDLEEPKQVGKRGKPSPVAACELPVFMRRHLTSTRENLNMFRMFANTFGQPKILSLPLLTIM